MRTTLLSLFLLTGCTSIDAVGIPVTGSWGGEHVGLTLGPGGGNLEYDCASGTIGAIAPDSAGRFTATGTHLPGHGGPDRLGEVRPSYPTRYSGTVEGDRMTLQARTSTGLDLGPFTLRRGAEPNLLRCL